VIAGRYYFTLRYFITMIDGVGIDLLQTKRFAMLKDKSEFARNVFTEKEILQAAKFSRRDRIYATLFTLKEAILKAFGLGLHTGSFWQCIEIGKTLHATLSDPLLELARVNTETKLHVSTACTSEYALSVALAEMKE
jgi:holo-[acyl-carrier-protein] synthase